MGLEGSEGVSGGAGVYTVVKCGASGHNIRSQPSLKAPPVGMLVLGNSVTADCDAKNGDGEFIVILNLDVVFSVVYLLYTNFSSVSDTHTCTSCMCSI